MLFNSIFGRKNSNSSNSSSSQGVKLNKKNHQPRSMTLEPLETRDLLSVTTGAIDNAEYAEIRVQYPDFNLPKLQADLNVMTITPDDGALSLADLKSAIAVAGTTQKPDLILVRTSATANSVTYTSSSDEISINIDASRYGSVTIIGWGEENFTLDASQKFRVMSVSGSSTIVNLGGLTIQGGKTPVSGGGIYNSSGTLTVTNSMISGNIASSFGGGIYNSGTLIITNSEISRNVSSFFCGGIYNSGTLIITNSEISRNNAYSYGGGIYNESGTLAVTNSEISGNIASSRGGGIYNESGTLTVTNSTIAGNTASGSSSYGGGIYQSGSTSSAKVYNTIIACNTAKSDGNDIYNTGFGSVYGYNSLSSCTEWGDEDNNVVYDQNLPLFIDANIGDYRLAIGSQAIDKGNNAYAVDSQGVALVYDLDGFPRIVNGAVDIGAYEYNSYTVLPIPQTSIFVSDDKQVFGVNIYPVDNAAGYRIEYSLNDDFSDSVIIDAQVGMNELVTYQKPQTCYWRVKAVGDKVNYLDSDYSVIHSAFLSVPVRDILLSTYTPKAGTVITATLTPADATAEYQWYSGDTLIEGATGSSFTVTADQIGQTITCVAEGTDGYTNTVSATTEIVSTITLDVPVISPLITYNNTIIIANWSIVDNANSYTLEYQLDGADQWTTISNIQSTSASFIGALGQTYNVRVKSNGEGAYSDSDYSPIQTITIADNLYAQNDFVKTTLNTPAVIDYRANDEATDWSLTTAQFGKASHGEYTVNEDRTIVYTPEEGFFGTDGIGYVLVTPSGKTSIGTIVISVGLPIATSVQKTSGDHTPSTAMAPSVDSLTEWDSCYIELWAQGVNELSAGETTITMSYNPAIYSAPTFAACADGAVLSVSQGVEFPDGSVQVELTVSTTQALSSQTDNLFLGTVVLTPSMEQGAGIADPLASESVCSLNGVNLTTTVETMSYDLTHSGKVDVDDFVAFAIVFGLKPGNMSPDNPLYAQAVKADFNKDGVVNSDDFIAFATNFGASKAAAVKPVAQPSATAEQVRNDEVDASECEIRNTELIDSQVEFSEMELAVPTVQPASPISQSSPCGESVIPFASLTPLPPSNHSTLEAYSAALLDLYDNLNQSAALTALSFKAVDESLGFENDSFDFLFDDSDSDADCSDVNLSAVLDELELELA